MDRPILELELEARGDNFPLAALERACKDLHALLRGLDRGLAGQDQEEVVWSLETASLASPFHLRIGSANAALEPRVDAVFAALTSGLASLDDGPRLPPRFTTYMLEAAKDLCALLNTGLSRITVGYAGTVAQPTQRVAAHVDMLTRTTEHEGTVEGQLELVNAHSGLKFYVYDVLTGRRVACAFTEALREEVKDSLFERVEVRGTLERDADGRVVSVKAHSLRRLPPMSSLPQFFDVKPLDLTGGQDPADYIEELYEDAY